MRQAGRASSINILVIDDQEDICDYLVDLLGSEGYRVRALQDPRLAKDVLREERFHIVILDLLMPEVEGVEVLRGIRRIDKDVAVVIYTAFASLDTAIESLKLDVSDYIRKPSPQEDLLDRIAAICKEKGLLTHPEKELQKSIGTTIRRLRREHSLTLKDLSRRTDLSVSLISQIERAESSASVNSLYRIASALNCRMRDFFGDF